VFGLSSYSTFTLLHLVAFLFSDRGGGIA
jgi:hypothetical protein